ncbi:DUF6438 domain-containing protein [Chloroflexota bacterium]
MKIIVAIMAVCLLALGVGACEMSQSLSSNYLDKVTITLERAACHGLCPVYTLTIQGDGAVVYEGTDFVKTRGRVEITIPEEKIEHLLEEFEAIDYFNLNDKYTERAITDAPSVITSITVDGKTKTVEHYHGDFSAPKELNELEDEIDEIINTAQWIN